MMGMISLLPYVHIDFSAIEVEGSERSGGRDHRSINIPNTSSSACVSENDSSSVGESKSPEEPQKVQLYLLEYSIHYG